MNLNPTTVAPLASFTASGRARRKTASRFYFREAGATGLGTLALSFTTGGSGQFSRTLTAPGGSDRNVEVILRQRRSDGVWAQVDMKLLAIASGGGGTVPDPNPPPGPGDITAPVISGVSATQITTTGATVSWTLNEAGTGQVEYGTTAAYGSTTTLEAGYLTSHVQTISGLTPGQTYHYRVKSADAAGNMAFSSSGRTFTTTASPTLPGAPTGLTATGGNTQIVLNWTAPANNGGSAITGYRIRRNGALLTDVGVVLTYTNTGLANGTTYSYTVATLTAVGEGPQSNAASATTNAGGDINPPTVSNVAVSQITQTGATITCTTNEAATVRVEYGVNQTQTTTTSATSSGTSHSRILSGLTPSQTYQYRVLATDTAGNLRQDSWRSFTTLPPTPPGPQPADTFSGDATGQTDVTGALNAWIASRPDGAAKLAPNGIYRISNRINIARHNLEIIGQGAQTRYLSYANCDQPNWYMTGHDLILRNLTAKGAHPNPGTYHEYCEWCHGFEVNGGHHIELDACHSLNNRGDGLYVSGRGHHVSWHDGSCRFNGRMGVAVVDGDDVLVEDMAFERIAYSTLDCEPNPGSGQSVARVEMRRTTTNWVRSQFFASYGYGPMDDITVEDNTVTGAPFGIWSAVGRDSLRMSNVIFRNNHGDTAFYGGDGAVFSATNVDGLIVTNNSNPVTPGQGMVFLKTTGCSNVTNSNNVLA